MFPNLLPDMTCLGLGSNITASPIGLMNLLMMGGEGALDLTQMDLMMTVLTAVIWTLAFLLIGIFAVSRREM